MTFDCCPNTLQFKEIQFPREMLLSSLPKGNQDVRECLQPAKKVHHTMPMRFANYSAYA